MRTFVCLLIFASVTHAQTVDPLPSVKTARQHRAKAEELKQAAKAQSDAVLALKAKLQQAEKELEDAQNEAAKADAKALASEDTARKEIDNLIRVLKASQDSLKSAPDLKQSEDIPIRQIPPRIRKGVKDKKPYESKLLPFEPKVLQLEDATTSKLRIKAPTDARLYIDDKKMNKTPDEDGIRNFAVAGLTPGDKYIYRLKLEWSTNNTLHSEERTIEVGAGKDIYVELLPKK